MAAEPQRVDIGLGLGQTIQTRLDEKQMKALRKAVEGEGGWYDLETEDGTIAINLSTVVFIRVGKEARSIGFGG